MAKVKVTTNWPIIELIAGFNSPQLQRDVGEAVVDEAKRMIASGQSPVKGYGRFERYKDRIRYPGKQKSARPVNLDLTGEMLQGYDHKPLSDGSVTVGMVRGSSKRKEIAQAHNDGTDVMAQRKIIPTDGETWAPSIMRKISDVYRNRLYQLIRQSNKK